MSNTTAPRSITEYMSQEKTLAIIKQSVGNSYQDFITTVSSLVANDAKLKECEQKSLLSACLVAASLNLPVANSLGFAYILPYNCKVKTKDKTGREIITWALKAQFQLGYRGLIQLALRSGEIATLNVAAVKENEIVSEDVLTGEITFSWRSREERLPLPPIGYVSYIKLKTGFSKHLYMSIAELEKHASDYSKTYQKGRGVWKEDFDAMASKTVLKLLLAKYAPMTPALSRAIKNDQAVIEDGNVTYPDNDKEVNVGDTDDFLAKGQDMIEGMDKEVTNE